VKRWRRWKHALLQGVFCYLDPALGAIADGLKMLREWRAS